MTDRVLNVLFLCTGNSARSILAESILRHDGHGRFASFSAGSQPKGTVHPLALKTLERLGYPIDDLRSKPWDEFEEPGAPTMDFVFTVCDNAAGEVCPIWPGQPITAHWGIEDPAAEGGSEIERKKAFATAFRLLKNRISIFTALPLDRLDRAALSNQVGEIGRGEGASALSRERT
jgi:arsenate reductase